MDTKPKRGRRRLPDAEKGSKKTFHASPEVWRQWEEVTRFYGLKPSKMFQVLVGNAFNAVQDTEE